MIVIYPDGLDDVIAGSQVPCKMLVLALRRPAIIVFSPLFFVLALPTDLIKCCRQDKSWNSAGTAASPGRLGQTCQWAPPQTAEYPCHRSCRDDAGGEHDQAFSPIAKINAPGI